MNSSVHVTRGSGMYPNYEELYGFLWYAVTAVSK
jgi:hypothetical protein